MEKILKELECARSWAELESIRVGVVGKKGILTNAYATLKELDGEEKKQKAQEIHKQKTLFETLFASKKQQILDEQLREKLISEKIDVSLFSCDNSHSKGHPVNIVMDKIISYFVNINFEFKSGPLIEDDFHNFQALNLPPYHPARDMQDTFYFSDAKLLRTHTSPVQIRTLKSQKPPIRIIAPGAVFRRDYDLTHSPMFHQVEGLMVGENISFANLKFILEDFLKHMFGDIKVRFRSSFFPFTEPSAEVDISCVFCGGEGCRVCSSTGWLEVLGCGMVNDSVFEFCECEGVSGYAFGLGVERFAMLIFGINDLRSFFEADLRVLEQF